jgi:hypothetical protein
VTVAGLLGSVWADDIRAKSGERNGAQAAEPVIGAEEPCGCDWSVDTFIVAALSSAPPSRSAPIACDSGGVSSTCHAPGAVDGLAHSTPTGAVAVTVGTAAGGAGACATVPAKELEVVALLTEQHATRREREYRIYDPRARLRARNKSMRGLIVNPPFCVGRR